MRMKEVLDTTTNSYEYSRWRKIFLESQGLISCSRCHYHRGCNKRRFQRTWKKFRKKKYHTNTQIK